MHKIAESVYFVTFSDLSNTGLLVRRLTYSLSFVRRQCLLLALYLTHSVTVSENVFYNALCAMCGNNHCLYLMVLPVRILKHNIIH